MTLQFRVRGDAIQVVRVAAESGAKPPKREPLGMIPQSGRAVPAPLSAKLTEEEKAELAAYVAGLQRAQALRARLAAETIHLTAAEAAQHLATVRDTPEGAALLAVFEDAMATLRGAMRAAPGGAAAR